MRIIRYQIDRKVPRFGWLLDNKVGDIDGNIFGKFRRKEATIPVEDVRLLVPMQPSKIICIGRNYVEHAREHDGVEDDRADAGPAEDLVVFLRLEREV